VSRVRRISKHGISIDTADNMANDMSSAMDWGMKGVSATATRLVIRDLLPAEIHV
jgi:hypothetical protein